MDVYLVVDGVKYWIMLGPSGPALYRREGSKTKYLGRRPLEEVRRLLAQAGAEALQKIKSDVEAVKQTLERQRPAQTAQTPSLTWRKDGHTYWILQYGTSFYIYVKGPSTRHKPRLIEKTDVTGVISRVVAAGAAHVLEALRLVVNGLHAAVVDLLRPAEVRREASHREAQASRKEAEEAFRELRRELSRAVERWDEKWRREAGEHEEPDREWLRERLSEFIDDNMHLVEKILPHRDLVDHLADAVEEETYGYLTRYDVLELLK